VRLTTDPWFVDAVVLPQFRRATNRADADMESARQLLAGTEGKLRRLQDAYVDGGRIEEDYYNRKLKELRVTRGRQQAEVERLEARATQEDDGDAEKRMKAYWEGGVGKFQPDWPLEFRVGFIRQHFAEIIVSERGVELLTVRVPQGPDGIPDDLRVIPPEITWADLLGYDPFDKSARLASGGFFTSAKIAERLGVKDHRAVNHLLRGRVLAPPAMVEGGVRYWTEDEAQGAEEAYRRHTAEPEAGRWGLPRKERYYRPDIAHVLGMTENQVRYAVKVGRIPVGSGVDEWSRPFWTEVEVEGVVDRSAFDRNEGA